MIISSCVGYVHSLVLNESERRKCGGYFSLTLSFFLIYIKFSLAVSWKKREYSSCFSLRLSNIFFVLFFLRINVTHEWVVYCKFERFISLCGVLCREILFTRVVHFFFFWLYVNIYIYIYI